MTAPAGVAEKRLDSTQLDSALPLPRLVSGDQPRRLSPLWSQRRWGGGDGWGYKNGAKSLLFGTWITGSKREKVLVGKKEVLLAHNAEKTGATLNIKVLELSLQRLKSCIAQESH